MTGSEIASKIIGNIYIVSVDSDLFFTDYQNRDTFYKLCKVKENVFFKTIKSDHGHDAFLIEFNQLTDLLFKIFSKKSKLIFFVQLIIMIRPPILQSFH